jgi:ATP-binding cassette, subfamily B (MDR/TAP), member 1
MSCSHLHSLHRVDMAAAFAAANRIRNTRPSSQDATTSSDSIIPLDTEKQEGMKIEFSNVSFKYPTRDITVLDSLSLKVRLPLRFSLHTLISGKQVEAGQFAAIVGPSGTYLLSLPKFLCRPLVGAEGRNTIAK